MLTLQPGLEANAIWWQDGVVRLVGRAEALEKRVPSRVPRYEFRNGLVTPGFVDGHTRFGLWALNRQRVDLAGVSSRAEALARIDSALPEGGWIRGQGWDANRWEAPPDRSLDRVTSHAAFLESADLHAAWVNSAAMGLAGITPGTPDPFGGRIIRDASGEPTGVLLERAQELVARHLPPADPERLLRLIRAAQHDAHRHGITGIHDLEGAEELRAFRQLEGGGELKLRVLFHPPVGLLPMLLHHGVHSGAGTPWLRLGGAVLFLDGTLRNRTAWMLDPYVDGRDSGMPLSTEDEVRRAVEAAALGGIASTVHAAGDAAVRRALDLLTPLPAVGIRHRIEQFQCVNEADMGRAGSQGLVASMQPGLLPGEVLLAEERWGERARGAYAWRRLLQAGTVLAFGSNVPVGTIDPRAGIAAAMDRVASEGSFPAGWYPDERLGFEEAVSAYTLGNAIAEGLEGQRGRVRPGADADLVVWEVDEGAERGIGAAFREARVRMTVAGGEVVFVE